MLVIRDAQMQLFHQQRSQQFLCEMADYVRRREPALVAGWSDELLQERLALARQNAAAYGISDPLALAEFFSAMYTHGLHFDAHPAIAAILTDEQIGANRRIHEVWARTGAAVWAEAAGFDAAATPC